MNITTVLCCYQGQSYLPETLDYLSACLMHEFYDVVCINDGSHDGTSEILTKFSNDNEKVRFFDFSENKGLLYRQNWVLSWLGSDIVHFLSHDDLIHPEAIKLVRDVFVTNPNIMFAFGMTKIIDKYSKFCALRPLISSKSMLNINEFSYDKKLGLLTKFDNLFYGNVTFWSRKKLVDCGAFPVELGPIADGYMARRLFMSGEVYFEPTILGSYRKHSDNWSNDLDPSVGKNIRRIVQRDAQYFPESARDYFLKQYILRAHFSSAIGSIRWRRGFYKIFGFFQLFLFLVKNRIFPPVWYIYSLVVRSRFCTRSIKGNQGRAL